MVELELNKLLFMTDLYTLNNMAVAYRRKGELARAVEIYRAALAKEPDNPKILYNAAVAYVNRKEYLKARDLLLRSIKNAPDFSKAQVLLRQVLEVIKKNNLAQEEGNADGADD